MQKQFNGNGTTFSALNEARQWLTENGYSYGRTCGNKPIGVMRGDYDIAKWRNLSPAEKFDMNGRLTSDDWRNGPVVLTLDDEVIKVLSRYAG